MTKFQVAEHILTPEEKEKANKYCKKANIYKYIFSLQIKN